jgi:hypothetical protein
MEVKELLEWAKEIYEVLNSTQEGLHNPIGEFIEKETKVFDFVFADHDDADSGDQAGDAVINAWKLAFALGYVMGNEVDLIYPDTLKAVAEVKQVICEKGLLPYLPREKKVA